MLNKKRLSVVLGVALVAVAIFVFAGLPFAQFGWTNVQAQYFINPPSVVCPGEPTLQARYGNSGLTLYADAALKLPMLSIPKLQNLKLLVCPGGVGTTSLKVYYAGGVFYAPLTSNIVGRGLNDAQ